VRKAVKAGRIPKEPDKTIDPVKADAAWDRNTNPAQQRKPEKTLPPKTVSPPLGPAIRNDPPRPGASIPAYQTSRAIRETYAAKMAKLDFDERTKDLVKADEVQVAAFNTARRVRDRILSIPSRMASVLAAENEALVVEKTLQKELRYALEELIS